VIRSGGQRRLSRAGDQRVAVVVVGTQPVVGNPAEPPFQTADCSSRNITLISPAQVVLAP